MNEVALRNIFFIVLTLDTSHLDTSELNNGALRNTAKEKGAKMCEKCDPMKLELSSIQKHNSGRRGHRWGREYTYCEP